jgi:hypothetical protein
MPSAALAVKAVEELHGGSIPERVAMHASRDSSKHVTGGYMLGDGSEDTSMAVDAAATRRRFTREEY